MAENTTEEQQLQEQLTAKANEVADLQRKLKAETDEHTNTKQELADANTLIDDLNQQLANQPAGEQEQLVSYGVGKNAKQYRVLIPSFQLDGVRYEREDVKTNSELLKKLIERKAVVELVEDAD